ncbi:MAG TPA: DUF1801 domain-containing protein [Thermoanaerobaculia bacterium]|jgi:hypothetical protein
MGQAAPAVTVESYLASLPEERRDVVAEIRDLIRKNLPKGYVESVSSGMLTYEIPLEKYPDTYNGQPLSYLAFAPQKNGYSLYLMGAYSDEAQAAELRDDFARAGKKLDMGKSCVRFKKPQDLALDAIAKAIASTPPDAFIARHEAMRAATASTKTKAAKRA